MEIPVSGRRWDRAGRVNEPRKLRKHTFAQSLPPHDFVNWRAIAIFYCADNVLGGLQKEVNHARYLGQFGFEDQL